MEDRQIKSCYLCGSQNSRVRSGKVRDIPEIKILECTECGLVYLGSQEHISNQYYLSDYEKELFDKWDWQDYLDYSKQDDQRRASQILPLIKNRSYLDVGCGAGGVVLNVKNACKAVAAVEPMERWRNILIENGIKMFSSPAQICDKQFDVVSMFHVLEHIPDPVSFLCSYKQKLSHEGRLIIEVPNADDALISLYKSVPFSEFIYWSPHLYYFNSKTLTQLLTKSGYEIVSMQQYQRYPLSNHLKWLATGSGGGHLEWSFLDSPELTAAYSYQLAKLGKCDTLIAQVNLKR